jgi:hypothetical protein
MTRITCIALASALILSAGAASADDHRSDRTGHPLAILGALLHPVGVVLDYVIFRPAHWLAHHEPVKTLTGHEDSGPEEIGHAETGHAETGHDEPVSEDD